MSTSSSLPVPPPNKASSASPKANEDVELTKVQNGHANPHLPLEEDIMQCARIGALEHIQQMIQSAKCDANYKDEEDITPLHVR